MRAFKSKVMHISLVLLTAFFPLAFLVEPFDLYIMIGTMAFALCIAVVHAYWITIRTAVSGSIHELNKTDAMAMALILVFTFSAVREIYITSGMMFDPLPIGRPDEYYLPLAFFRYGGGVIAPALALYARDKVATHGLMGRRIPGWPRIILPLVVGLAIGIFIVWWT